MKFPSRLVVCLAAMVTLSGMSSAQKTATDYFNEALPLIKAKKSDEAIAKLTECITAIPDAAECIYRRALMRELYVNYASALEDWDRLTKLRPDNSMVAAHRAQVLMHVNRSDEGLAELGRAITLDPKNDDAYYQRGNYWRDREQYDKAIADYSSSLAIKPKPLAYQFRGTIYSNKRDYDKAIADYTSAIQLQPNEAIHYYFRGKTYYKMDKVELGEADLKKSLELDPSSESRVKTVRTLYETEKLLKKMDAAKPRS